MKNCKKTKMILSLKKGNNSLVLLLFFVISTLFTVGCSKSDVNDDNTLNERTATINLNTTKEVLLMNYTLKKETKSGVTTWSGSVIIAGNGASTIFSLSYKSSITVGSNYKHTFEDTKNNKIVFTTDMNLHNAVLVKSESSLTGYTFI